MSLIYQFGVATEIYIFNQLFMCFAGMAASYLPQQLLVLSDYLSASKNNYGLSAIY